MEKLATQYAVRISKCESIDALRLLWGEINTKRSELGRDWIIWLNDLKDSKKGDFAPEIPDEEYFNKEEK